MTNETITKPTLTPEQARAIELAKMFAFNIPTVLENVSKGKQFGNPKYSALESLDIYTIMSAIVNGYEIEKSPEERLREYYEWYVEKEEMARLNGGIFQGYRRDELYRGKSAIESTLEILGITIEGINADKP